VKITDKIVTDSIVVSKMQDSIKNWDDEVVMIKKKFLEKNPASIAAIWLLSDMIIRSQVTNDEAVIFFKKMDETKLVAVPYYKDVAKRVDAMSATGAGKAVPGINSTNTFDGNRFDLASLKGKYVVLDFWGTWCGPCIAGMPKMKEYREKYKDKMEIVGVASESDNGERWKKFLTDKPEYQWPHLLSRKNEEDFILKFNVAGFPTKIIVDPNGLIVGRYVGEDDDIYKKLDEILSSSGPK
jgi:thiol-disulfide isomerase/thioredoxin